MRKKTLGLAVGAAMLFSIAAPAAAMADTTTVPATVPATTTVSATTTVPTTTTVVNTLPSVGAAFATFDQGGADLGRGLAELVSGALIGAPQLVTALPCELAGANAPAPCAYTG
jgi:hypothetical protein